MKQLYALVKTFRLCTGRTETQEVVVGFDKRNLEDAGQEWMGVDDTGSYNYDIVPVTLSPELVNVPEPPGEVWVMRAQVGGPS